MRRSLAIAALLFTPAVVTAQVRASATFAGFVVDSVQHPIANAEVSLPGLSISIVTNDKGTFRLTDIPAGLHRVVVRRIGYGQLDTVIAFAENQTVERRITLGRIVTLDSVVVVDAKVVSPFMAEFEANRARGFGRFITREELDKKEGQPLGSIMQQLAGLDLVRGNSGQSWVLGKHAPPTRCPPTPLTTSPAAATAAWEATDNCLRNERMLYVPEPFELRQGMKRACYAMVYLDRSLMNAGRPTPPFDLNSLAPGSLDGVEWYADAAQTPPQYNGRDSACGLVLLHLRRGR
jgi:hypothetical protein